MDKIVIRKAREHNLKSIDLEIPKNRFIVITGLSGSGKSSLAFDTLYAEGQRRYVESLSTYARQFLGLKGKPDVEYIEGLSPAIAIQQRILSHNPRSIIATITEIYDYLRVIFARIGVPYCPNDNIPIAKETIDEVVETLVSLKKGSKLIIFSNVTIEYGKTLLDTIDILRKKGFVRIRLNGKIYHIDEISTVKLTNKKYSKNVKLDVVIDRIVLRDNSRSRLYDSIGLAFKDFNGICGVQILDDTFDDGKNERLFSENFYCPICGWSIKSLTPTSFSFNNPNGACSTCSGLGFIYSIDPDILIRNPERKLSEGLINHIPGLGSARFVKDVINKAKKFELDLSKPFEKFSKEERDFLLYGKKNYFEGVINIIERRMRETRSQMMREWYLKFFTKVKCPTCNGSRLKSDVLSVKIKNKNIWELTSMTVEKLLKFFKDLKLKGEKKLIGDLLIQSIVTRLEFLKSVGLSYLTLDRTIDTLSGGEIERIKLATQLGTKLTGVIYILDEPTIGLHSRDTKKLLKSLKELRDIGNTVIVVEHDRETIEAADWVIDLGPGSGSQGGEVVFSGTYKELLKSNTLTSQYLTGKKDCQISHIKTIDPKNYIKVYGASEFNLKNLDLKVPLNRFVCITGVSGAGKSTLMEMILYRGIRWVKKLSNEKPGQFAIFKNLEKVEDVKFISQQPIGRMSKSNVATYTHIFDLIRDIFAHLPESKIRGFSKSTFSFNVKGGRCEACQGEGVKQIEMHFLPNVYVKCDVCNGKRYNKETLGVKYKGKSISDVLDMTVEEAYNFFDNIPILKRKLKLLLEVGLGYITLGQPSPTLSGGEAQRIKLARELSKKSNKGTIYFMDEPTTGLHLDDVSKLLSVIERLRDSGNTVVVIEHNLDVIKNADWIIDLGPEGGDKGGYIVAEGEPEEIMKNKKSYTGQYLIKLKNGGI